MRRKKKIYLVCAMKSDVSFVLALQGRSNPLQAKLPKLAESFGVEEVVTFKKQ